MLWFTARCLLIGALAVLLVPAFAGRASAADEGVKEGQPAPDIALPATQIGTVLPDKKDAKELRLKDFEGKKNVVLFFFPKAKTGG